MKKIKLLVALVALCMATQIHAGVEFAYEAGAEVVSAYLWRGQYNGGLSLQPNLSIGYEGEHTSLSIGAWGSIGASDWKFVSKLPKTDDYNPNTYFVPELDLSIMFSFYGVMLGATHYYYCDGGDFFNWGKFDADGTMAGGSQTEVTVGIDLRTLCEVPLSLTWNTMVAGNDLKEEDGEIKRAYSTYIEAKYDQPLPLEMTLSFAIGISPWKSEIYNIGSWNEALDAMDIKNFALNNISIRLDKEWEVGPCTIDLFGQGMLNTCGLNSKSVFSWGAGDDKINMQKLNGAIGLGLWF